MNKQTDPNIKTIRFPADADSKLQKMCDKCGLTRIEFFVAMVDYFYKSKKDPRDLNDELLKKELIKRTDTIIAFIRTMEEELLRPLKKDGEKVIRALDKIIAFFNEQIIRFNADQKGSYKLQTETLNKVLQSVRGLEMAQTSAANMKKRFTEILEYYIQAREQFGMSIMSKQADRDKLIEHVRSQIQLLKP
jgi:Tfp pilus assembly protein PilN